MLFKITMQTNLTGVFQALRGHQKLKVLYSRILQLSDKLPRNVQYKTNVEAIICHRLSILQEAGDDRTEIENGICCGSLEMLISQAENEYNLLQKMLTWKPWEPLVERPPPGQWDWPPAKIT